LGERLMAYFPLGPRPSTAKADMTGLNTGNWTALLDHSQIGVTTPVFEMYHLFIESPTLIGKSTTATVLLNLHSWDVTLIGQANSWDPAQPLLMTPGDDLAVMFNVPTTTTPVPVITAWFRYQI
jgi:hypothetical protein